MVCRKLKSTEPTRAVGLLNALSTRIIGPGEKQNSSYPWASLYRDV